MYHHFLLKEGGTDMKKEKSKISSFEEKLSEIMQTIPGEKDTILPDLSALFGGGGYEREVEDDEQYQLYLKVKDEVSKEAEELYNKENEFSTPILGSCHAIWAIEKRIYRERYGIEWHTPQEMHPEINFD